MSLRQWAVAARYEVRVAIGGATLLPALLLPAYAALQWLFLLGGPAPSLFRVAQSFELILPLTAGLSAAYPLVVEREAGFARLRSTYPEPAWRMPCLRVGGTAMVVGAAALLGWGIYRLAFGPCPPAEVLLPALAPTLYLLGLSALVSRLTGSYWAAAGTSLGYWFFEVFRRGEETGVLFLFRQTWPVEGVDYGLNRWLLAGLGALLTAAAAWHAAARRD